MSTRGGRAATVPCRVIISVSGGVAEVLLKPAGVEVRILDYDVDGVDADRLDHDEHGQPCSIQRYAASQTIEDAEPTKRAR